VTRLPVESYLSQQHRWPVSGRVILANFDADSIVVYQAYRPAIGAFAAANGYLGGEFSLNRMSWIKPNFLWMMYRSGWGMKEGQEVTLAVRIQRSAFDAILAAAVHSSFDPEVYVSMPEWQRQVAASDVRLQWDPDHGPDGRALERRAVQLGLRGDFLAKYAREWILDIEDVSDFVREQRTVLENEGLAALVTPREDVYPVADVELATRLKLR
jgi:hypothetical protein